MSTTQSILLRPRPYAQHSGSFFLVALLPPPKYVPSLPAEIWSAIFEFVAIQQPGLLWPSLTTFCCVYQRPSKEVALPLLYARVAISKITSFEKFVARLHFADQRWDSIRRIPWSTPGRWVQAIDLSGIEYTGQSQALLLDSLLVKLFPLVPFLARFSLNPSFVLSRRAMEGLGQRPEAVNIRALEGLSYIPSGSPVEDSLVQLLRYCPNLEELELIGRGLDPAEMDTSFQNPELSAPDSFIPLALPCLRTLTIISVYSSTLFLSFLLSPLPSLQKLTITPYDDVPTALSSQFICDTRRLLAIPTPLHPKIVANPTSSIPAHRPLHIADYSAPLARETSSISAHPSCRKLPPTADSLHPAARPRFLACAREAAAAAAGIARGACEGRALAEERDGDERAGCGGTRRTPGMETASSAKGSPGFGCRMERV
ncbi:hypothetical protein MSAN_02245700 [Mycena sanguinolenta]|uniref:F-box domain-containing protein n=1 Tax=Mycena sanguinolenta TaxID=230812 RepID=A0A8H7CIP2_9AGAR|nr:hypothetical protein MSAN_02245700 [Mycena sanguinolenta]